VRRSRPDTRRPFLAVARQETRPQQHRAIVYLPTEINGNHGLVEQPTLYLTFRTSLAGLRSSGKRGSTDCFALTRSSLQHTGNILAPSDRVLRA
jgi:hypothetical protein